MNHWIFIVTTQVSGGHKFAAEEVLRQRIEDAIPARWKCRSLRPCTVLTLQYSPRHSHLNPRNALRSEFDARSLHSPSTGTGLFSMTVGFRTQIVRIRNNRSDPWFGAGGGEPLVTDSLYASTMFRAWQCYLTRNLGRVGHEEGSQLGLESEKGLRAGREK